MEDARAITPSRRTFLSSTVATVATAAIGGCSYTGHGGQGGDQGGEDHGRYKPPREKQCCLHVRRRLSNWTDQDFSSYRHAVSVMQSRPVTDPTSWIFQANMHGAPSADGPNAAWRQCQHGTPHFLTWHRMYLYWWERIVRKASGDPAFAIGYWRYDPGDAASLALPLPFRSPTVGNPLFSSRNGAINGGAGIPGSAADSHFAMLEPQLLAPPSPGFSSSLEGTPHGAVHVQVGGLMGSVPTAARDPIFWTHHTNIDRLWSRWLDNPAHANPASGPFVTTVFQFVDEDGKPVQMSGKDVLKTVEQLCYRYDDDPMLSNAAGRTAARRPNPERVVIESKILSALPEPRHALGAEPSTFKLDLPPAAQETFRAAIGSEGAQRIVLEFEGASVKGTPDTTYEVYLNLPAGQRAPGINSPHFAGSLAFFGLEEDAEHANHGSVAKSISLNVTPTVAALQKGQAVNANNLAVTVVPVQAGAEPGGPVRTRAVPSFRRIVLRSE